ncbi:hypothetical protein G9A89_016686 [Geosiphon pyriformis]|nr:hypothetical protein G9A89_016686 [Geosiphon pyriformis]
MTTLVPINTTFQEDIFSTGTEYHTKTSLKLFYSRQPTILTRMPKPPQPTMTNHGQCLKELLSDQRTHLINNTLTELSQWFGIKRLLLLPYHPQTNGLVE